MSLGNQVAWPHVSAPFANPSIYSQQHKMLSVGDIGWPQQPSAAANKLDWTHFFGTNPGYQPPTDYSLSYRNETMNLPQAYHGNNVFLSQLIVNMISMDDQWPIREALPWRKNNLALTISWDKWIFDNHLLGRNPEQSVPRLLTSHREVRTASTVRFGIAFMLEFGFMDTPDGVVNYNANLRQMANAIIATLVLGAVNAILNCDFKKSKAYSVTRLSNKKMMENLLGIQIGNWGCIQKLKEGIRLLAARQKETFRSVSKKAYNLVGLPRGTTDYLDACDMNESSGWFTNRNGNTPSTSAKFRRENGITYYEWPQVDVGYENENDENTNPSERSRMIGDFFQLNTQFLSNCEPEEFRTAYMNRYIFDEDIDSLVCMQYANCVAKSFLFEMRNFDPSVEDVDQLSELFFSGNVQYHKGGDPDVPQGNRGKGGKYYGSLHTLSPAGRIVLGLYKTWYSYLKEEGILGLWIRSVVNKGNKYKPSHTKAFLQAFAANGPIRNIPPGQGRGRDQDAYVSWDGLLDFGKAIIQPVAQQQQQQQGPPSAGTRSKTSAADAAAAGQYPASDLRDWLYEISAAPGKKPKHLFQNAMREKLILVDVAEIEELGGEDKRFTENPTMARLGAKASLEKIKRTYDGFAAAVVPEDWKGFPEGDFANTMKIILKDIPKAVKKADEFPAGAETLRVTKDWELAYTEAVANFNAGSGPDPRRGGESAGEAKVTGDTGHLYTEEEDRVAQEGVADRVSEMPTSVANKLQVLIDQGFGGHLDAIWSKRAADKTKHRTKESFESPEEFVRVMSLIQEAFETQPQEPTLGDIKDGASAFSRKEKDQAALMHKGTEALLTELYYNSLGGVLLLIRADLKSHKPEAVVIRKLAVTIDRMYRLARTVEVEITKALGAVGENSFTKWITKSQRKTSNPQEGSDFKQDQKADDEFKDGKEPDPARQAEMIVETLKHIPIDNVDFVHFSLAHDCWPLFNVYGHRLSKEYIMAPAAFMRGYGELGNTLYGRTMFTLSDNAPRGLHVGVFNMYAKSLIFNEENLQIVPDVFCVDYVGGNGSKIWDFQDPQQLDNFKNGQTSSDIVIFLGPPSEFVDRNYIDVLGYDHHLLGTSGVDESFPAWHRDQAEYIRLSHPTTPVWLNNPNVEDSCAYNTICFETFQLACVYKGHGQVDIHGARVLNKGHWGVDDGIPGVAAVRKRMAMYMKMSNYSHHSQNITGISSHSMPLRT